MVSSASNICVPDEGYIYIFDSDSDGCNARPLLGHHALVRVVGFRMAGFMLSGSGIRACVLGNVELGWGGWGKVQFNVGG